MKKFKSNQDQNSVQLSEPGAACHFLTQTDGKYYKVEDALIVALNIIDKLSQEILSQDALYLAISGVLSKNNTTLLNDDYQELVVRFYQLLEAKRKSNPLSGMF